MTKRATVDDFPIGCTVKVVRLPKSPIWDDLRPYLGATGIVVSHYSDPPGYIAVNVGRVDMRYGLPPFRPWWLECGRVEWTWIPEKGSQDGKDSNDL